MRIRHGAGLTPTPVLLRLILGREIALYRFEMQTFTRSSVRSTAPAGPRWRNARRGAATLDYILVLGIVLPILAIVIPQGRRMMQLVFEMTCALISWPFM
jgi:hypothetical protein